MVTEIATVFSQVYDPAPSTPSILGKWNAALEWTYYMGSKAEFSFCYQLFLTKSRVILTCCVLFNKYLAMKLLVHKISLFKSHFQDDKRHVTHGYPAVWSFLQREIKLHCSRWHVNKWATTLKKCAIPFV